MEDYIKKLLKSMKENMKIEEFIANSDTSDMKDIRKGKAQMLKEALNLKTLREMTETKETRIQSFRRFVIREKNNYRRMDYNPYHTNWTLMDSERFLKEANYLKDFQPDYNTHVKLTKEIDYLEDMSDEQILCYYTLVREFHQNIIGRINVFYAKYYVLELANLVYQQNPTDALLRIFEFWDALVAAKKRTYEDAYLKNICDLFIIAHPDLITLVVEELRRRGCIQFERTIFDEIKVGDYRHAKEFVRYNARLLKEEELLAQEDYSQSAWNALPYVMTQLSKQYRGKESSFEQVILKGGYEIHSVKVLPMKHYISKNYSNRIINPYEYFEWTPYANAWRKKSYVLEESVQDLLNLIYAYTESFMREAYGAKNKRKRSAARVLNKKYSNSGDDVRNLSRIKKLLEEDVFSNAIEDGIKDYVAAEKIQFPEKETKKTYVEQLYEMDHAKVTQNIVQIDIDKLHQARADADTVVTLLQQGEIDYDAPRQGKLTDVEDVIHTLTTPVKNESTSTKQEGNIERERTQPENSQDSMPDFTKEEASYLRCLLKGDEQGQNEVLSMLQIPENIMIKQINQKALKLFSDVLIEKDSAGVYLVEDYMEELSKMLG